MLTDKKSSKVLKPIMIKYIHKCNDHNFFCTTLIIKYMFQMNFNYNYVDFIEMFLGYLLKNNFYIIQHML